MEEYWYSTFLKVVPFYARAKLLRTPQQSDAPGSIASGNRREEQVVRKRRNTV